MLIHIARKQAILKSFMCIPASHYMWLRIIKRNTESGVSPSVGLARSPAPHCSAGRVLWTGSEQVVPDGGWEWNSSLFKGGKSFHQCRKTPKKRFLPPPFPSERFSWKGTILYPAVLTHSHTHPRLNNVLSGCCTIYWLRWWWWH